MVVIYQVLNGIWLEPSFLKHYLKNREMFTGQMGGSGHQKETQGYPEWQKSRFPRVERERRHSTNNKYLLSAYYVPGTVLDRPPPKEKQEAENANSEGEERGS